MIHCHQALTVHYYGKTFTLSIEEFRSYKSLQKLIKNKKLPNESSPGSSHDFKCPLKTGHPHHPPYCFDLPHLSFQHCWHHLSWQSPT